MMLTSKEHYDVLAQFEKQFSHKRLDKEPKERWSKGNIYQDGNVNDLFIAFRNGVAYGKAAR